MSKWEPLQGLILRMPGGKYIGNQWLDEPLVEVRLTAIEMDTEVASREPYSFQQNLLIAVVERYGPLVPDADDSDIVTMQVPEFVADLLQFWQDESSWAVDW
jgi:hypothetical protein